MGITEKEFLDEMVALAKAGENETEHLKCVFYTWSVFFEADRETTEGIAEFLADAAGIKETDRFVSELCRIL